MLVSFRSATTSLGVLDPQVCCALWLLSLLVVSVWHQVLRPNPTSRCEKGRVRRCEVARRRQLMALLLISLVWGAHALGISSQDQGRGGHRYGKGVRKKRKSICRLKRLCGYVSQRVGEALHPGPVGSNTASDVQAMSSQCEREEQSDRAMTERSRSPRREALVENVGWLPENGLDVVPVPGDGLCLFYCVWFHCGGAKGTVSGGEWNRREAEDFYMCALDFLLAFAKQNPDVAAACCPESAGELQKHSGFLERGGWKVQVVDGIDVEVATVLASKMENLLQETCVYDSCHHGSIVELWALITVLGLHAIIWNARNEGHIWVESQEEVSEEEAFRLLELHPNALQLYYREIGTCGHYDVFCGGHEAQAAATCPNWCWQSDIRVVCLKPWEKSRSWKWMQLTVQARRAWFLTLNWNMVQGSSIRRQE